jgi:hypothetical protein
MSLDNIKHIKVFPGIGTARVGNSPEYFIGPESPGSVPNLGENYKDANGLLKPQASRFRVFGYDANDNLVAEITHDPENGVEVEWDVHMRNLKAANYAFQGKFGFNPDQYRNPGVLPNKSGTDPNSRDSLIIDPGPKTISGLNQNNESAVQLDGGTIFSGIGTANIPTSLYKKGVPGMTEVTYNEKEIPLGRLETDEAGRLIVVGGKGDAGCLIEPPIILQKGIANFIDGTNVQLGVAKKSSPSTSVPNIFYTNTVEVDLLDQVQVLLSSNSDGTGDVFVDDQCVLKVNGKQIYCHDFSNGNSGKITPKKPIDITEEMKPYLGKKVKITIEYVDLYKGNKSASAFWLSYINNDPTSNGNSYFNNPGWYDDTSGGSINANVTINGKSFATGDNPKKRGWVAVSPPKYVPTMNNVVSLLDLQLAMFPEQDPVSGTLNFALLDSNGIPNIVKGKSLDNLSSLCGATIQGKGAPSITSYKGKEYVAYTSSTGANIIASSEDGGKNWTECQISHVSSPNPSQFITDYAPSLCVFNGMLTYVITNSLGYLSIGTSTDGEIFNFESVDPPKEKPAILIVPAASAPSAVAYNGSLYIAYTSGTGDLFIVQNNAPVQGKPQTYTYTLLNTAIKSEPQLAPSIAVFFGELYYAYTGTDHKCYLASYNNYAPAPTPPVFTFDFKAIGGTQRTKMAPAIGSSHGIFYYAVIGEDANDDPFVYVASQNRYLTTDDSKLNELVFKQQIPAVGISSLSIANFSDISFFRDVYPILKTVTDYAWVNEPAFQGHAPGSMGDFLRDGSIAGYSNPNKANNPYRTFVFNAIRPAEQLTPNVPPPPMQIPEKVLSNLDGGIQSGRLMPHLFGEGGSNLENTFNNTNFPNQWLSLTPHQLWKIQEWVNGNFETGTKPTENFPSIPLEDIPLAEQPAALNFSALEPTVGGGFHPGIELTYYMKEPGFFAEAFRFADNITHDGAVIQAITPGSVAGYMSIPWQGDFWSCNISWWAAMRPDIVVTMDQSLTPPKLEYESWFRGTAVGIPKNSDSIPTYEGGYEHMVRYWSDFGYVVPTGTTDEGMFVMEETERAPCLDDYNATCTPVNKAEPIHLAEAQSLVPATGKDPDVFYTNSLNVILPASGVILLSGNKEGTDNIFADNTCVIKVNGIDVFSYDFSTQNNDAINPTAPLDLTYILKPYVGKIVTVTIELIGTGKGTSNASNFWLAYP